MKKMLLIITVSFVFLLSSCKGDTIVNNFDPRQDNTLFSEDGMIIIDYKTSSEGELIEINIDRLLTIEQMILLNPNIDYNIEIEGFTGTIFVQPSGICTNITNDILVPVNIEIGNTRYKYDDDDCMYKTIDNNNQFKPGFADEYLLTDTILENKNVEISIIVYNPAELVAFVEIYNLPHTYETLGVYNILINEDRDDFEFGVINYYRDMAIYEQLYLKHQDNESAMNEVMGISQDLNLMDLGNLTEVIPLIDNFEVVYEMEIQAINELQDEIGVNFTTDEEPTDDDTPLDEGQ